MEEHEPLVLVYYTGFIGQCTNEIHVKWCGSRVDLQTFEAKGCWTCKYLRYEKEFVTVQKASEIYNVSKQTVRNWCKKEKLTAFLCNKGRHKKDYFGAPKMWLIYIGKNET